MEHPDELRVDLDPQPGTGFEDARTTAFVVREVLDELGMRGFPKTSGNRGIHINVRIEPRWSFTQVRQSAIGLAREVERRSPGLTTTAWWKEERGEKVFIDYNQNARDRTIAGAYSVRAPPHAPVSTPVTWEELADLDPRTSTSARSRRGSPSSATCRPRSTTPFATCACCSSGSSGMRLRAWGRRRTPRTSPRCPVSHPGFSRRGAVRRREGRVRRSRALLVDVDDARGLESLDGDLLEDVDQVLGAAGTVVRRAEVVVAVRVLARRNAAARGVVR